MVDERKVPEGWVVKKLKDLSTMKSGNSITSKKINDYDKIPCYGGNGLRGYTYDYTHEGEYALIGRQGALCGNVQFVSGVFFASEHAIVVTPNDETDIKWLFYMLTDMGLNKYSESSAQPGLSVIKILNLELVAPADRIEQKFIAEALSDTDNLIQSLENLIDKKKKIKQGAMQQLLTGKKRLPGFSGEWEVFKLGEVVQIFNGGTPSTSNSRYWDGSIKWCTPTDITSNKSKYLSETANKITELGLNNSSAKILPIGTLLFCSRATIGEVKIANCEVATNQGFKSIVTSAGVNNEWLYYWLVQNKMSFIEKAIGSTFLEISKKDMKNIEIALPSVEEQKAIAQILSDMDAEIEALEEKLEKVKTIKQGMMQELLTGRIRLI